MIHDIFQISLSDISSDEDEIDEYIPSKKESRKETNVVTSSDSDDLDDDDDLEDEPLNADAAFDSLISGGGPSRAEKKARKQARKERKKMKKRLKKEGTDY